MVEDESQFSWPAKFEEVVIEQLPGFPGDTGLTPETNLVALGLTSIRMAALLVSLEDAFGIPFPDELLRPETFQTPGTLWSALAPAIAR
jgi:acyl carrier protein